MKTLPEFKQSIKSYFDSNVHTGETWDEYWDMIYGTLEKKNMIVIKNGIKYVKDVTK